MNNEDQNELKKDEEVAAKASNIFNNTKESQNPDLDVEQEVVASIVESNLVAKEDISEEVLESEKILNNFETLKHINEVRKIIFAFVEQLEQRAKVHDASKFESPEVEIYARHYRNLKTLEFGSPEYEQNKKAIEPALKNHYSKNRHHPQHWPKGVNDMSLIDILEMLADWIASTRRTKNGNIRMSLQENGTRYKLTGQLEKILENTIRELFPLLDEGSS